MFKTHCNKQGLENTSQFIVSDIYSLHNSRPEIHSRGEKFHSTWIPQGQGAVQLHQQGQGVLCDEVPQFDYSCEEHYQKNLEETKYMVHCS